MFMTEENFDEKKLAEFYAEQLKALEAVAAAGKGPTAEQVQKELAEMEEADKE